jgi:hypothetical protein
VEVVVDDEEAGEDKEAEVFQPGENLVMIST